ncbi:hypothetical protein GGU10DRAFT_296559 [Lentinula aff. detonsa]|uniref:trimethyllysine dioxygenase n=1 Tax=Lentinula aff. detonsa TaxID=2804958 RepID=A0AA38KD88_9AGAR|nr:hypothetical protein GGU10DRAFT_296559 [Lentinula aff. detonsa]
MLLRTRFPGNNKRWPTGLWRAGYFGRESIQRLYTISAPRITKREDNKGSLQINWEPQTNTQSRFDYIWLRDHCLCTSCVHPKTKQRMLNTFEIPNNIKPLRADNRPDGLVVVWPHEHESVYPWEWLKRHSYDPPIVQSSQPQQVLWNAQISNSPPTVSYEDIMKPGEQGDRALLHWLSTIHIYGFSFISGVPPTPSATETLVRRIAFIRETHYGAFWEFTSDLGKGDTAYTNLGLDVHTDNTYFTDPSGLQLFHLLDHSSDSNSLGSLGDQTTLGGQTILVDGFHAASLLRSNHPSSYHLLSNLRISSHASGDFSSSGYIFRTEHPTAGYPVLTHNPSTDQLVQVRWNNYDRAPIGSTFLDANSALSNAKLIPKFYSALSHFHAILSSDESRYVVQLKPGTAVVLDNHRVLHGRTAFTGRRRMCGAYVGADEWRARLAGLRFTFEDEPRSM